MDLQATKSLKMLCHNSLGLGSDSDGMFNITRENCLSAFYIHVGNKRFSFFFF